MSEKCLDKLIPSSTTTTLKVKLKDCIHLLEVQRQSPDASSMDDKAGGPGLDPAAIGVSPVAIKKAKKRAGETKEAYKVVCVCCEHTSSRPVTTSPDNQPFPHIDNLE